MEGKFTGYVSRQDPMFERLRKVTSDRLGVHG
ncbi:hypothetical protein ABIB25_004814 [Nakamurella sp. UYEF19]